MSALHRALVVLTALALACTKPSPKDEPAPASSAHTDEAAHEGIPKKLQVPPDVVRDARITAQPVTKEVLATTIGLAGEIAADPDRSAKVASPVPGHVEEVKVKEGDTVKKGDPIVRLRVPDLGRLSGTLAATQARAKSAHANADRLKSLVDQRLAAEQTWVDAKTEAEALDAEANALSVQLSAMGAGSSGFLLTLRAPIAGTVVARDAIIGQPVTPEQVLASITDLGEVWFLGRIFEKDLGRLEEKSPAEVTLNAYPKEHFQGTLEYLGKQIDPVARTLVARIRLPNKDQMLRLGLFGVARIGLAKCEQREAVLVVPRSAVMEVAGKNVVFVEEPDGDYEVHEVTLGDSALGKVQVVSGLREGEKVVITGAFTLKSMLLKSSLSEEE